VVGLLLGLVEDAHKNKFLFHQTKKLKKYEQLGVRDLSGSTTKLNSFFCVSSLSRHMDCSQLNETRHFSFSKANVVDVHKITVVYYTGILLTVVLSIRVFKKRKKE